MTALRNYLANILAAYLDFTIGCLGVVLLAQGYGYELMWWQILLGGVLALLPDIDITPILLLGQNPQFDHRQTIFHRPLVMIPVVSLTCYAFGGSFWALTAVACLLWHFLHDVDWFGRRYGVAWFWPFSKHFWSIYGAFTPPSNLAHQDWLASHWLRPTQLSVTELSFALLSAICAGLLLGILTTWWFMFIIAVAALIPLFTWFG